ncbi:hypothetical protein JCM8115_001748 [Rhodotorula mucilaginosa]|uniref:Uncharacterized protein n=1 Tax=Rhodotorula mucilaginosa TaxID=5537 RepID=A0A9P7B3J1_RHOMI|nr:hypothetical protein C6P46_007043 [Rhodotorula mucilaginosa]
MSAASGRGRRDSDDPPTTQTRESADSTLDGSLAQFDPLAGYAEPQNTPRTTPSSKQAERPHRPDATSSTLFGVKSDSQIGRHSKVSSEVMQRSNSSEAMPAQGVRVARRESWHAGQTTSSPEEAEMLRSSTSGSTARLRRRSTSAQTKYKATALQPPKLPELRESDDEFRNHVEMEKTSSLHHLPLVLVAIPSLGAILHGRAENWSDAIVLALVVFYLYNLIKIPWEMYYASYARTVLPSALSAAGAEQAEAQDDPTLRAIRLTSAAQLKRAELFSLSLTFLVPALGAALLYFARGLLSDPDRYINRFLIGLFALASSIKPISHAVRLLKQNSLYHQEIVHYPSSEIAQLKKRLAQLETTSSPQHATKSEAQSAESPTVAAPPATASVTPEQLDTLSRSFRRHTLAAAHFQTTTSTRLDDLANTISQLVEVIEAQEGEIVRLQQQQHHEAEALERVTAPVLHRQSSSHYAAGGTLKGVVRHLLLYLAYPPRQRRRSERRRGLLHRLVSAAAFVPVTAPKKAIGWAFEKSARGAVHLLGWEDGDEFDYQQAADEDEDEDDSGAYDGCRRTIIGTKTQWPRGLPAPPLTSASSPASKALPGSFVSVSERQSVRKVGPVEQTFTSTPGGDDDEDDDVGTAAETSVPRRTGLGASGRASSTLAARSPTGEPNTARGVPVRASGGGGLSYSNRRSTAGAGAGAAVSSPAVAGAGIRLVSAH